MVHDFKKFPELTNAQFDIYYMDSPFRQITEDFRAKVVRVIDGDTVELQWAERDFLFPLRLNNIQAPEMKDGDLGIRSRKWLENELLGNEVEIVIDQRNRVEKWGRLLGIVMHGGVNINEMSVNLGYATTWQTRNDGMIPDFEREMNKQNVISVWE